MSNEIRTYALTPDAYLYHADCRDVLRALPENSLDSCVCDPPYHLTSVVKRFGGANAAPAKHGTDGLYARQSRGFMQKQWDGGDIAFDPETWALVLRVLKPGAHLVAFGASRGYHRMACAIEDAGFEIRDSLIYLFGTGFPKSHQLDNKRGDLICGCDTESPSECDVRCMSGADVPATEYATEERSQVLQPCLSEQSLHAQRTQATSGGISPPDRSDQSVMERRRDVSQASRQLRVGSIPPLSAGVDIDGAGGRLRDGTPSSHGEMDRATVDANGMCSSLGSSAVEQSAHQSGTVAGQSQSQDGGTWPNCRRCGKPIVTRGFGTALKPAFEPIILARKPLSEPTVAANVLRWRTGALNIDACRVGSERLPAQKAGQAKLGTFERHDMVTPEREGRWPANVVTDGSAEVIEAFPQSIARPVKNENIGKSGSGENLSMFGLGSKVCSGYYDTETSAARFFYSAKANKTDRAGSKHPTIKPVALMEWLCRLVTPKGGVILDPFAGSGTTGAAALRNGFRCVLVEREAEYVQDIIRRIQGRKIYGVFADEKTPQAC